MDSRRWQGLPARVIAYLEDEKINYFNYIITFFAVVMLRQFFESYSQEYNAFDLKPVDIAQNYYHYTLAYMAIVMTLGILFHYVTRAPITQVFRVLLPCMLLLVSAPLLDLLLTWGRGTNLLYLQPGMDIDLGSVYLSFLGGFKGLSTGMRIEAVFILAGFFLYFRIKNCSVLKSVLATWAVYTITFMWGSSPYLVSWVLETLGFSYKFSEILFIRYYLLLLFPLSIWVAYLSNKKIFHAVASKVSAARIIYYELSLLFGAAFALSISSTEMIAKLSLAGGVLIALILTMISVFLAALFSQMTNTISDVEIEKISDSNPSLIAGVISISDYRLISYLMFGLALFYASLVNAKVVLNIAVIMSAYYAYSAAPLRLQRIPVLSKLIPGFNSFVLFLLGFLLVQGNTTGFPNQLMLIYFIAGTIAANFIDLKDVAGDKAKGIVTLPMLVGERTAKLIIGAAGFLMFLSFYFIFPEPKLVPILMIDGAVFFYLVNKSHYQDWQVMLLLNGNLLAMVLYLVVS